MRTGCQLALQSVICDLLCPMDVSPPTAPDPLLAPTTCLVLPIHAWYSSIPRTHHAWPTTLQADPFADSDDEGGSDADSTASSELLDFDDDLDDEADAFSGDIGRSATTSPPRSAFFKGFEPMGVPGSTA